MRVTTGIGITTKDRPELLEALLVSIRKHTFMDNVTIYVADDTFHKQGVAKKKNECLRALKGFDHIFLLDDDVEVIKDGWIEYFINSGHQHLLFLNDKLHNPKGGGWFKDCGGVFMYMRKSAIERVGAFNEKFTPYGFEHAEYSIRILGEHGNYPCLTDTDKYIYAHDYSNPNHKSSITDEEKKEHIRNNWDKFFKEPINQIYIPL